MKYLCNIYEFLRPWVFRSDNKTSIMESMEWDRWHCLSAAFSRTPEDLMDAAVFLTSGAPDFANGQILYVDGSILTYIGKHP